MRLGHNDPDIYSIVFATLSTASLLGYCCMMFASHAALHVTKLCLPVTLHCMLQNCVKVIVQMATVAKQQLFNSLSLRMLKALSSHPSGTGTSE